MQIFKTDKTFLNRILNNRLFQHLTYWVVFVFFFAFAWGTHDDNYKKTIWIELINLPAKIILVYTVIYLLFPRFLYKGNVWLFIFLLLHSLLFASILQRLTDNYLIIDNFFPEWNKESSLSIVQLVRASVNFGAVLAVPMTVKIMEHLNDVKQRQQNLAKDKLEAELMFLKNQVQPHFLFNTLNSLYSLILTKSERSLEVILKLSDLLRYMLYETNAPQVDLSKELGSIRSYLDLEKIRYGSRVELSFNAWGDFEGKRIAPMLILPFIENSFKHSTKGLNETAMISIEMGAKEDKLILKVENSIPLSLPNDVDIVGGLGLQNVKRRLDLLYANEHQLKIESNDDSFLVILKINLKDGNDQ
ncbi:sensor histidine kinase [Carboxylicivirga sp. N1Y90]|uniref:sensor histidine kinase n=1 Tax=Carboxylicivirga fragile TaxID=3417571 RepID=UPI003D34C951|nr:histidine kinase [Marinilabiliaceae bacterium N1Y90]